MTDIELLIYAGVNHLPNDDARILYYFDHRFTGCYALRSELKWPPVQEGLPSALRVEISVQPAKPAAKMSNFGPISMLRTQNVGSNWPVTRYGRGF